MGLPTAKKFKQPEDEIDATAALCRGAVCGPCGSFTDDDSLARYASQAEVILVDDGCPFEIIEMLETFQAHNNWKLIRHDSPLGHSRASEHGASIATRPILCLLNSDTVVTPWSWKAVVTELQSNPAIAAAGPLRVGQRHDR